MMNLIVFTRYSLVDPSQQGRSVTNRLTEPLDWLSDRNALSYLLIEPSEFLRRIECSELDASSFTHAIFNKSVDSPSLECVKILSSLSIPVIYDLDDLIFSFPEYSQAASTFDSDIPFEIMRASAHIVCANYPLKQRIAQFGFHNSSVIEHGINISKYVSSARSESSYPSLVITNADSLKIRSFYFEFILALKKIKDEFADLQIDVFSDKPGLLGPHIEVNELGSFPYDHHKSLLASSGYWLALVPLSSVEDPEFLPFHICKCPIKYLDYGMASIPAIFSDAYIYQHTVRHMQTSILSPNTHSSWLYWIRRLVIDRDLRLKLSRHMHQDVCSNHSIDLMADSLFSLFSRL